MRIMSLTYVSALVRFLCKTVSLVNVYGQDKVCGETLNRDQIYSSQ